MNDFFCFLFSDTVQFLELLSICSIDIDLAFFCDFFAFLGRVYSVLVYSRGYGDLAKGNFSNFFVMWARAAYPHIRPDQLMGLCWKVLFPLALLNIVITGVVVLGGEM